MSAASPAPARNKGRLTTHIDTVWELLCAPSAAIWRKEMRRRARMLAALVLLLVVAAAVVTLAIPWIVAPGEHAANRVLNLTGLGVVAIGLGIYAVSRTRHYEAAAWLAVFAAMAAVTFSLYASQGTLWQDGAPYFLALSSILATLLLPLPAAAFVVLLTLALPIVFYHTIATFGAVALSNSITFLAITSALLLVTGLVRYFDIHQIRTQAAALAESEERYRTLFHASFEGLVLHEDGRILEVNEAMTRLWGRPSPRLLGAGVASLVAPGSRQHLAHALGTSHNKADEAVGIRPDGDEFPIEFITKPYLYQGRLVQVTGFRDITERKEVEMAREKARELEATNERLLEIDRLKTHILNVTSHELNTPITPLRLQVHLLKGDGFGRLNERQRRSIDVLERNLDRLSRLIKDILDVSKIEAGRLRLVHQEVEVTDLVKTVVGTFVAEAKERGIRLQVCTALDDWAEADPTRLRQALSELVSNALRFTPPGGRVTVESQGDYKELRIEVRDTGVGLSAKERARLFRPFDPVQEPLNGPSGRGLGLYIAKGIVDHHGGRIDIKSRGPGKGCRVRVVLPKHPGGCDPGGTPAPGDPQRPHRPLPPPAGAQPISTCGGKVSP